MVWVGHGFQRQKNEKLTTRGEKNNRKQGWTYAINNLPVYLGRALCAYSCSVALLEASSISVASGFGQKYQHLSTHVCCVAVPTQRCAGEVALLSTGKQEMIREQTNHLSWCRLCKESQLEMQRADLQPKQALQAGLRQVNSLCWLSMFHTCPCCQPPVIAVTHQKLFS